MKKCGGNFESAFSFDCGECNEKNCPFRKTGNVFITVQNIALILFIIVLFLSILI
jgi:hypothetical protein